MSISIVPITPSLLQAYAEVSSGFQVRSTLTAGSDGTLKENPVEEPYVKNYDRFDPPEKWPERFDVGHWGFFLAVDDQTRPAGGAAVAWDTPDVGMLEGRRDLAVLWDLRVKTDLRRHGIGKRLFEAAVAWARERGCRQMKIETQSINAPACRFYEAQGARLDRTDPHGYDAVPSLKDETMFIWILDL